MYPGRSATITKVIGRRNRRTVAREFLLNLDGVRVTLGSADKMRREAGRAR